MRSKAGDEQGQMTVEFAAVFPVMLIAAAIALHAMVYAGECARFDEVARNAIRLEAENGTDPEDAVRAIEQTVAACMDCDADVTASCEGEGIGQMRYTVEMELPAAVFGMPLREVAGFRVPPLAHHVEMTVCVRRKAVVL